MTETIELSEAQAIAGTIAVTARRIGLVADEHCDREDGSDLPDETLTAFAGVDLILHLGHMGARGILGRGVLDRYAAVAPVLGVRDYSTDSTGETYLTPADGDRVAGLTRVIEASGVRIGAVHNLGRAPGPEITTPPGGLPELESVPVPDILAKKFGGPVEVVAYAGSHRPAAITSHGVLFVNPGSPTYPRGPGRVLGTRSLGTVGILHLSGGSVAYEAIDLTHQQAASSAP